MRYYLTLLHEGKELTADVIELTDSPTMAHAIAVANTYNPGAGDFVTGHENAVDWIETEDGNYLCPDPDEADDLMVFEGWTNRLSALPQDILDLCH